MNKPTQNEYQPRIAAVSRNTNETQIRVVINLDGTGQQKLNTGVPFLDHMLDQIARHGLIDLEVEAVGDLHIDAHHTVEDVGITLGQACRRSATKKASVAMAMLMCHWMKHCHGWWSIFPVVPDWNITFLSPVR